MRHLIGIGIGGILAVVAAVAPQAPPLLAPSSDCRPSGDVEFVCGQQGPEDLVVVPGAQWVVASVFGGRGGINLIRVRDRMSMLAYPSASAKEQLDAKIYNT